MGRAKAVVLAHYNLMACNATWAPAAGETLILAMPLLHVYGFTFCLRAALAMHTLVLHTARRRFDIAAVLDAVGRFGVTCLALAPPALLAIVRTTEEDATTACMATLKAVSYGGAPIAATSLFRVSEIIVTG
ncbi:unnamed protein product [Miscanthus lutarioriparius]|uniref:AMP-dependent synthetase/ligase domain-containing protein n=1 Tax=Miscanthus lutarioriparius TaxID=422564 RepID=A0A811NGZ4_9POAL|nr:unnamed protein product [Miscanthus lutarioriparius]